MLRMISALLTILFCGALFMPVAEAQVVTGEVTDPEKRIPFRGAIVRIEGQPTSSATDDRGRFRLANVPAGNHTLVVSYVGTADTRIPITVPAEGIDLGAVILGTGGSEESIIDEVLVYGQSAAVAGAINQERAADNLLNALDTDAMGQFPDQNVAESLNRLPGVSVENDQGEGRYVVIRGMDPDLNSTSINGVRAVTGEQRRALQLDVIPSDVLDGLEVNKTLTPDMDGDAIGGSINVKTLSAFSRNGAYFKARAEGGYTDMREEFNPKVSVAGSNLFEMANGRRLGVAGAISYNKRNLQIDNNEADGWEEAENGNDFVEEFGPRLYQVDRERSSAVLNFDLDVSDNTALHLYTLYSEFEDTELRDELVYGLDGVDEDSVTSTSADYYEAELEHTTKDRVETADTTSISFGSDTQLTDWLIKTNFGYSHAKEKNPSEIASVWVAEFESEDGPVLSLDRSNPQIPLVHSDIFDELQDPSSFELDEVEFSSARNEDEQYSVNFDGTRQTGFGELKFGVKGRWREKQADEELELFGNDADWTIADVLLPNGAADYGFPNQIDPIPSSPAVRNIYNNLDGIEFEDADSELGSAVADFNYQEDIYSAYAMGKWETERTTFVAGVRVESTDTKNNGNLVELVEEGEEVDGVVLEEDTVFITPVSASKDYTDWLPSANLKFDFSEALVGRASVYRSVVRPRVEEVAYRVAIEDGEAEIGNPDLDPFSAWNFDASLSYYPTELSVLSAGIFHKKIEDFIFLQEIEDYEFEGRELESALIALNGEDADVTGLELNYQQHFGFLGEPWDAFLIAVNYTYVDSDADTGDRTISLPKQSENIGSFMIGYDKHGFDLRLAMKYRDKYIDELVEEGYDRYTDAHLQWDFTAKYNITEAWQIYGEIVNINDEPEYYYAGRKSRLYQYDEFGTAYALGVQYNFQ